MHSRVIRAWFRFYGELNDFLSPPLRQKRFPQAAAESDTIKHLVESIGVPHTEVELILVDSTPVGWDRHLQDQDEVAVYPAFATLDIAGLSPLTAASPNAPVFVLDGHLGRLAAYLRMLGFDVLYSRHADDEELARIAEAEDRILLTRDVGLLKRKSVLRGRFVRADNPKEQLIDIVLRYNLLGRIAPFSRCMECNGPLLPVAKEQVAHRLPPHTRETKDVFSICSHCAKVYWKGSHHSEMTGWIKDLRSIAGH